MRLIIPVIAAAALFGCGHTLPTELSDARMLYGRAASGDAVKYAPGELVRAKEALDVAEKAYEEGGNRSLTRDFAYVAQRRAELAENRAAANLADAQRQVAQRTYEKELQKHERGLRSNLSEAERQLSESQRKLTESQARARQVDLEAAEERRARIQAESKIAALEEHLFTLSGSVLFASGQSTLLPTAFERLNDVANALLESPERRLIVEGHTDSQGSSSFNANLSQRRAEAVRSYLISRGYSPDRIVARGMGEDMPITSNGTAEGRANNRRVEIKLEKPPR